MNSATETTTNVQRGEVRDVEDMEVSVHSLPRSVKAAASVLAPS
jgi:hypothetical protein